MMKMELKTNIGKPPVIPNNLTQVNTLSITKNKKNGQIIIPDGYEYISSEAIPETYWIKYNFINTVPVTALEYKHNLNDDIAFPYSGTPIQLENENSKQKTLS